MSSLSGKQSEMGPLAAADKNKQWQRELLMERLRSHSSQHKTFPELSKAMRMSMLEKRYALDSVEKSNLQKCLDSMQHCIKVTTRQGLIERLESLSRQLGLKFMEDTSGLFISSDMFYLEIILDPNGTVSDVKVHHECKIEQQSCSELVTCLLKGDFTDFTNQLEGLSSIYQLNAEPKIKSKAFVALQAMETDLYNLFSVQDFHKDAQVVLLESIVGIVQKRRGGHPMKLTYFVPPYELLDLETKSLLSLSVDLIAAKNIGMSVTVNLEASSANKLQILPTVSFKKDTQGVSIPVYSQMSPANSTMLPATFVLRLNKPLPLCQNLRAQIIQTTELNFGDNKPLGSVMDLIVQNASNGQLQTASKGLFVTLPDQMHCYFLTENRQMEATLVTSVPFTEPGHVPQIISLLRQQAIFYTLLASCIRTQNKITDLDGISMLEVNASSIHQVSVALEHPFEESMATVEFDLSDPINVTCRIYSLTNNYDAIAIKLSKIVQKSMSIPITIRSLLKFWEQEQMKGFHRSLENGNFNLPLGPTDPGGRGHEFRDLKEKNERNSNGGFPSNGRQFFHPSGVMMSSNETFNESNVNMFEAPADGNIIMSQFAVKTANDANLNDVTMANTKEISPVVGEDFYKSPKSKVDLINSQTVTDNSDSNSLGKSTKTSDQGVATTSTTAVPTEFQLQQEKPTSFPIKEMEGTVAKTETKDESNLGAAEKHSIIESTASKPRSTEAPVRSSVSITPVTAAGIEFNTVLSNMGLERRPGIEIIPISASATPSLPTSITITPINSSKVEKKSSSSKKSEDRSKSDRKRKRKREESAMGPPEKVIGKSDALNRPVSVSIKSADGAPVSPSGILRKFSSSPIPRPPSASTATSSSSAGSSASASGSGKPSPKHSPVQNSPKHIPSGIHSPKGSPYGTASPKHSSSGSSGKPSMSALKSAANSPNSKSDKTISKSTSSSSTSTSSGKERGDKDKEKDRSNRTMSGGASPKLKTSTIKLKQIDLSAVFLPANEQIFEENSVQLATSGGQPLDALAAKSLASGGLPGSQNKVRKGSLSAVIDKLKSAQTPNDDIVGGSQMPSQQQKAESDDSQSSGKEKSPSSSAGNKCLVGASTSSGIAATPTNTQNSEYMVKPSLDGMKITINKTRTKDVSSSNNKTHLSSSSASTTTSNVPSTQSSLSSTSSSLSSNTSANIFSKLTSSGSSSPKRTTGLKPGVNSGPASKKAQLAQSTSKSSNTAAAQSSLGKGTFQKSNSSGNLPSSKSSVSSLSKSFNSNSMNSSDFFKKDKSGKSKSTIGDKPLNPRTDPTDVMKLLRFASSSNSMDGFMKSLNTKFQIPKLSARNTAEGGDSKKDPNRTAAGGGSTSAPTTPVLALTPSPPAAISNNSCGSNSSSSNDATTKAFNDIMTSKYPFSIGKLPMESLQNSLSMTNNSFSKFSNFYQSNASKYPTDATSSFPKDIPLLSKSPSTETLMSSAATAQRDFPVKHLSSSTPSTPLHMTHSPFTSPVGSLIMNNSTSPVYRPSPSASPNVQNDEMTMRPPSAPCAVDMTKTTELDLSLRHDSKNPLNCTPSTLRKPAASVLPPPKMSFPASPSVSVHIVKSPVPSPLMVIPSPHSNSPCITDDELMDEALVGISGK